MIEVRELTKRFGAFTAVRDLSFFVEPGEVFGFLGANGAGKTTSIRMMCGLLKPSRGDALMDDISVRHNPEEVKRRIGYMSQRFSLYGELSPAANVEFFGTVYGVSRKKIQAEVARLQQELGEAGTGRAASELPLGFKQRLGLACALLHDPPIIVLDEPTSGVDPLGRRQFWEEIYSLSGTGHTVLVTTHFMDEAEYCDRIAIMNAGRLIALDTPAAVKARYGATTLNRAFIRAVAEDRETSGGDLEWDSRPSS
ncbi:ABC transporter ATP-binding protein [Marispirochaeta aestuarii]|uniref:ABC transporter ATP-binding protein n=1 Tax=Marispirochaeta aestuarii TaxID=1963862 RepID=UPI0029C977F6|nr:ABC transporter ATP-binding protein [Marispirochaeta aestuarii]